MARVVVQIRPFEGVDPDLAIGGILTLERADGRSVWRQRLVVVEKSGTGYVMEPAGE